METKGGKGKSAKAMFHFAYKSLSNLKTTNVVHFAFLFVDAVILQEWSRHLSSLQLLMLPFQSRVTCPNLP